jgi:hypothetical protein
LPQWLIDLAWNYEEEKRHKNQPATGIEYANVTHYCVPNGGADQQRVCARARKLLATIPPGIQGQNGSKPTYRAACALVLGFGLGVDEALPFLREYSARCVPPWSDKELLHKLEEASRQLGPRGYLLADDKYNQL